MSVVVQTRGPWPRGAGAGAGAARTQAGSRGRRSERSGGREKGTAGPLRAANPTRCVFHGEQEAMCPQGGDTVVCKYLETGCDAFLLEEIHFLFFA